MMASSPSAAQLRLAELPQVIQTRRVHAALGRDFSGRSSKYGIWYVSRTHARLTVR